MTHSRKSIKLWELEANAHNRKSCSKILTIIRPLMRLLYVRGLRQSFSITEKEHSLPGN
jgi:hypothetical protein